MVVGRGEEGMESHLRWNFSGVKSKHSLEDALQRWRKLCGVVKKQKRRFLFTANLSKRSEAAAMKRTNQHLITGCNVALDVCHDDARRSGPVLDGMKADTETENFAGVATDAEVLLKNLSLKSPKNFGPRNGMNSLKFHEKPGQAVSPKPSPCRIIQQTR